MHNVNGFCVDIYTVIFPQELQELFSAFDKDGSGVIDFDEFLLALRVSLRGIGTIPRLQFVFKEKDQPKKLLRNQEVGKELLRY